MKLNVARRQPLDATILTAIKDIEDSRDADERRAIEQVLRRPPSLICLSVACCPGTCRQPPTWPELPRLSWTRYVPRRMPSVAAPPLWGRRQGSWPLRSVAPRQRRLATAERSGLSCSTGRGHRARAVSAWLPPLILFRPWHLSRRRAPPQAGCCAPLGFLLQSMEERRDAAEQLDRRTVPRRAAALVVSRLATSDARSRVLSEESAEFLGMEAALAKVWGERAHLRRQRCCGALRWARGEAEVDMVRDAVGGRRGLQTRWQGPTAGGDARRR